MSPRKFIDQCRAAAYRKNAYGERERCGRLAYAILGSLWMQGLRCRDGGPFIGSMGR